MKTSPKALRLQDSVSEKLEDKWNVKLERMLNFKRRIKSHLPFAGVVSPQYSPRFRDKG